MTVTAPCPRCAKACPVGTNQAAHCTGCFTSFRADAPTACLTADERASHTTSVVVGAHAPFGGLPFHGPVDARPYLRAVACNVREISTDGILVAFGLTPVPAGIDASTDPSAGEIATVRAILRATLPPRSFSTAPDPAPRADGYTPCPCGSPDCPDS